VTDRLLVFSDPEVQKRLKEQFIAVTGDDWYQRRRDDKEGEFFRSVVEQSPRRESHTKQGHYVLTAGGKLLGFNNNRGPERRLQMMREALEKWEQVREQEKGLTIPGEGKADNRYHPELPEGGQIVKVMTRCLEERDGKLRKMLDDQVGNLTAVDHLWLRREEIADLGQLVASGGGQFPENVALRIAKFHLLDNTRGEPRSWKKNEIKECSLKVDAQGAISGNFSIVSEDGSMGYRGTIDGRLLVSGGRLERFEALVLGKHWGESRYTRGARPGKAPLGQVFQLSDGKLARDRIPPQGIRWAPGYWEPKD
jgi:hypothetical protein